MELIEVKDLWKSFTPQKPILKGISLSVKKGEVLAIIGSSGSGKSTLLRCITQLETVDHGNITICGEELVHTEQKIDKKGNILPVAVYAPKEKRKEILEYTGLVFQNFNLFPHYSVIKNIMDAPMKVLKMPKEEAYQNAKKLLDQMGLLEYEDRYPFELSGGQQQRVSIARALAMNPEILCFDEPTSALDPELTVEVLRVIKQLKTMGSTMIIVTHEMEFAKNVADRILYMRNGIIEVEGTPEEVFRSDNPYLSQFLNSGKDVY